MGLESVSKLPLVDLSNENMKPGSSSWASACYDFRQALEEHGCLEVVYYKFSPEFDNEIFSAMEELFKLPQEIKMKYVNPKTANSYQSRISRFPVHEVFGITHAENKEECQKFTDLMWPDGNDNFCEIVHSYASMVVELQETLIRMLCESYGLEKHYDPLAKSTTYLLRLLRYRQHLEDTLLGSKGHTDSSFVTILHQNRVNGLQIRTKGGDWIDYEPFSTSSFVVLAGDGCMAWSNDRIKSCHHRVLVSGEDVRYSLGLFGFPVGVMQAPAELVDEDHPSQYKPFEYRGFLAFKSSRVEQNICDSNVLKAYCGV